MRQMPFDPYRMLTRCLNRWEEFNFLDLGASVGYTAQRAVMEFPLSRVWALEPEPKSFATLKDWIKPLKRVRAFNIAASDVAETRTLHIAQRAACSSLLPGNKIGKDYYAELYEQVDECQVQTVRLDQWAPTVGLDRIDILKIDVQGMELQVLRTLEKQLANNILAIDCEAQFVPEYEGASTFLDIACMLRDHGFMLHQVHNMWSCGNELQTTCMDGLWLKKELFNRLRETPGPLLDAGPAGVLLRAMKQMREVGMERIALFGAGAFTQKALANLVEAPVQMVAIADDDHSRHGQEIGGVGITSLDNAVASGVDAVVLCSEAHELKLFHRTAHLRERGVVVVPLIRYYQEIDSDHPLRQRETATAR